MVKRTYLSLSAQFKFSQWCETHGVFLPNPPGQAETWKYAPGWNDPEVARRFEAETGIKATGASAKSLRLATRPFLEPAGTGNPNSGHMWGAIRAADEMIANITDRLEQAEARLDALDSLERKAG